MPYSPAGYSALNRPADQPPTWVKAPDDDWADDTATDDDVEAGAGAGRRAGGSGRDRGRGGARAGGRRPGPRSWLPAPPTDGSTPPPLTTEQREKIAGRCMSLALWHLGQGPRTEAQLLAAMAKHQAPEDLARVAVDRMVEMGYVDDAAFAEAFVASRSTVRRQGPARIRADLRTRGVPAEIAEQALAAVDEDAQREAAAALVAARLHTTAGLEPRKRVNRLVGLLARRGYGPGLAYEVVRAALQDVGEQD